jgi:ATP-dependent DNA helicase RecG
MQGGVIIFGITEKGFHALDGLDVKATQTHCAQALRELVEPPLSAEILVLSHEGKPVVVLNVPEAPTRQKPCYVRKLGQVNGSYIRTGDGDHRMTLYEIDRFIENQQRTARHDAEMVCDATLEDLDPELVAAWVARSRRMASGRVASMDDETLLANRRIIKYDGDHNPRPTVAGLMALGSFPQKFFPRLSVTFTCYPSTKKGETSPRGERFIDFATIEGPVPVMISETLRAVERNMRHGAIVHGALRENVPDYPLAAVREAVANALMHRDYSPEGQASPVTVDLYPDRLEIANPGGLYGALTVSTLGERGSTVSRNQFLSRILEDTPYTEPDGATGQVVENRGTGYPIIQSELARALMAGPVVSSSLDEFVIVFLHRSMTADESSSYGRQNVIEAILQYFAERESLSTAEVARAAGISSKTARDYINRLIAEGLVEAIGSQYSPKRRYRLMR